MYRGDYSKYFAQEEAKFREGIRIPPPKKKAKRDSPLIPPLYPLLGMYIVHYVVSILVKIRFWQGGVDLQPGMDK